MNPVNQIGPVKPPLGGPAGIRRRQRPAKDHNEDQHEQPEQDKQDKEDDDGARRHRIDELA